MTVEERRRRINVFLASRWRLYSDSGVFAWLYGIDPEKLREKGFAVWADVFEAEAARQ